MTVIMPESLDQVRLLVAPAIRAALDRLDPRSRLVAGYHLGFWDADGVPTEAGGKGLRPAFALLSARAAGHPAERAVPAAVAVELVHDFSLLHDDVMDGDAERRHKPTAWSVFGTPAAILAGDALLSLAVELLAEAPGPGAPWAVRCLTTSVRRLVAGQTADVSFESRPDVTLDECLTMAGDKTAALFACACSLGAVLCDAPPELAGGLARYGEHLGLAFQLVDDLLGIAGTPEVTGKPVLSDLRARKKSVPVVRALTSGTAAGDRLAELYRLPRPMTEDEVRAAAEAVEQSGAREWAEQQAAGQLAAAVGELDQLDLPAEVRGDLVDLAGFVTGRDR